MMFEMTCDYDCIQRGEDMHRPYIARRFRSLRAGLSLDTSALALYEDIIDLSIGDTDLVTDSRIIEAAFTDARAGYTHYGDPKGDPELIAALRAPRVGGGLRAGRYRGPFSGHCVKLPRYEPCDDGHPRSR